MVHNEIDIDLAYIHWTKAGDGFLDLEIRYINEQVCEVLRRYFSVHLSPLLRLPFFRTFQESGRA